MNREELERRTARIRERLDRAAVRARRSASEIEVLPITKGHPPEVIEMVAKAGFRVVGENRVAEAEAKRAALPGLDVRWHMVGHLQRNKAARAVRAFQRIESVDTVRLGRRLQLEAERADLAAVRILIQVNAGAEEQKSGVDPDRVTDLAGELLELERLRVEGLMTMAPFTSEESVLRRTFSSTRRCLERCLRELPAFRGRTLSMGMSNDFEIAVEEGSTEVRLGTVLLGERPEVRWT